MCRFKGGGCRIVTIPSFIHSDEEERKTFSYLSEDNINNEVLGKTGVVETLCNIVHSSYD